MWRHIKQTGAELYQVQAQFGLPVEPELFWIKYFLNNLILFCFMWGGGDKNCTTTCNTLHIVTYHSENSNIHTYPHYLNLASWWSWGMINYMWSNYGNNWLFPPNPCLLDNWCEKIRSSSLIKLKFSSIFKNIDVAFHISSSWVGKAAYQKSPS